jgi:uncharacterized membrane protein YccC
MEPSLSWGLRMAIATVAPVVWGITTNHAAAGEWIALTADCICWVSLKGTYAQRLRILAGGIVLTFVFALLGSLTGGSFLLSVCCMLVVGFLAGLFRNLGDRGSGLALCVYIMFLVANAYPVSGTALRDRMLLTLIGGFWNAALAVISIFFLPEQQPYRRNISLIWRAAAMLMEQISKGWDGKTMRGSARDIYQAEKGVRTAIDTSFVFHERAAHQVLSKEDSAEYQLAQGRKSAALVAVNMMAISEELEQVRLSSVDEALRIRLSNLMRSIQRAAERMSALVLTRRSEEELLMRDALDGIRKQLAVLEEYKAPEPLQLSRIVRRVMQLSGRCLKMMERSVSLLSSVSEARVFRAYPVLKTIYVLHPRHWVRSLRLLFSFDSHTARYAARTGLAAALATAIYKWMRIDHGYWLPFTVIIVMQPYFIATFRKAIDRLIGTVVGGIAGGLLLLLPAGLHIKEAMLFFSAIAMVHFFRTRYRISAFFITLNLVLLLSVYEELDQHIILLRAGMTVIGALIAVTAGFLLLPNWDRKWLPRFLSQAVLRNWSYFIHTFATDQPNQRAMWTRCKRQAEVSNSNAFDSFNRATQEPGGLKKDYATYYQFITHNVRITRELNNIHLEEENKTGRQWASDTETIALITSCADLFAEVLIKIQVLTGKSLKDVPGFEWPDAPLALNAAQKVYLSRLQTELRLLLQNLRALSGASAADREANALSSQHVPSGL